MAKYSLPWVDWLGLSLLLSVGFLFVPSVVLFCFGILLRFLPSFGLINFYLFFTFFGEVLASKITFCNLIFLLLALTLLHYFSDCSRDCIMHP